MPENKNTRLELERKLTALDEEFARGMRARGFQPEQAENIPLTTELAELYSRRMRLAEELDALEEDSIDE